MSEDLTAFFSIDVDEDTVRLTPRDTGAAYLVLGWATAALPSPDGNLPVETGSGSYPVDSQFTLYRLEPIGRWPGGLPKPGGPQGTRCLPGFADCPIPPPPIPVGPIPPKPPVDEQMAAILRGSGFRD
jgi:hypothetical protein